MQQTKVKNTESHKDSQVGTIVCRGKLVLLPLLAETGFEGSVMINNSSLKPIIISETEEIEVGDYRWGYGTIEVSKTCGNGLDRKKILALPENFSPKHLQAIVDGKLKDGDEVFVECETVIDSSRYNTDKHEEPFIQRVKLNKNNHIKLFPVKKEEGWKEIFKQIEAKQEFVKDYPDCQMMISVERVKQIMMQYNPPTKK